MKVEIPSTLVERTIWAIWWLFFVSASLWLLVGSTAYWVKNGYLPADTAGWAQALGGFLAIAVAIGVPYFQTRKSIADRHAEERFAKCSNSGAAYSLVCHFEQLMRRLAREASKAGLSTVKADAVLRRELKDTVTLLEGVPVTVFGSELVFVVLGLRQIAVFCELAAEKLEAKDFTQGIDVSDIPGQAQQKLKELAGWRENLEASLALLHSDRE
ncbi:hypothetical protein ACPTJ8_05435 [Pseudomonas aeruginosa]|uniref:hypothetical protein n=1 Tax=Pseudomonas aeruginosa TaxID=287 RepID=UPI001A2A08F7|nr:hypothetical protein [Pseudomonas aeruginosa]